MLVFNPDCFILIQGRVIKGHNADYNSLYYYVWNNYILEYNTDKFVDTLKI